MRKHDLVLLLVLTLAAAWRWSPVISGHAVLPDEQVYIDAARNMTAGHSPYDEPGYFYPPPIAFFIHLLTPRVGEIGALRLLRMMALGGLVLTAWLALRQVAWPRWLELALGAAFFLWSPPVEIATALGNAAGIACGLVLLGLLGWHSRPILAGASLGIGLAIKPIAPIAPILLAIHRPPSPTRNHQIAAVVSVAAAAGACLPHLRFLFGLLENARGHSNVYNFSLHKLLSELGIQVPSLLILVAITVSSMAILRRFEFDERSAFAVMASANLVALPILWAHSMLLLLPVQLLALDACANTWRSPGPFLRVRFRFVVVLAIVAVTATLFSQAVGTTQGLPSWTEPLFRAVPLSAIPFLGWFVVITQRLRPPEHWELSPSQCPPTSTGAL